MDRYGNASAGKGGRRRFLSRSSIALVSAALGLVTSSQRAGGIGIPIRQDSIAWAEEPSRVQTFEAALKEMMDRSRKDPRDPKGWLANANSHLDYCATPAFDGVDQIHFCWWFLPWHRAYLSILERKLRELAGDANLTIPYWNWSSDRTIPPVFSRHGRPMASAIRYTPARRLQDSEVGFFPDDPVKKHLIVEALAATNFEAQDATQIAGSFGGIARPNPNSTYNNSRLESVPHGPVHVYVGGELPDGTVGDMTDFATAARDPLFFAHHANLDRIWEVWRQIPGNAVTEPKSSAFLQHEFPFVWLDGKTITVSVSEALSTTSLGYTYDSMIVQRSAQPGVGAGQEAQGTVELPEIASATIRIPVAVSAPGAGAPARTFVEIDDVVAPDRPMSVEVRISRSETPFKELRIGSFAAVSSGGRILLPTILRFDATQAIRELQSGAVRVRLVPLTLGPNSRPYNPLVYRSIRLVSG